MARIYRFFAQNIMAETFAQSASAVQGASAAGAFNLTENLEPEIFLQLVKVLRVKTGDIIVLLPAAQSEPFFEYRYAVSDVQKKNISLNFEEKVRNENELEFELGLILCLPNKPDKLEFILQKAVELGVSNVTLIESDFSQMKHNLRLERLQKILKEAAEQSERAIVPKFVIGGIMKKYFHNLPSENLKNTFVAMERAGKTPQLKQLLSGKNVVQILIGPEGGFSPEEKNLIEKLDLPCFSLGKRILRMETAAILSLGLVSLLHDQ